ncbi:lysylphosphatidylglycerol synthase domain-containing protein [Flammeovirga pectinis]|nr:lysylphosphatidylglycerol synthase domain-containing protein [Flammeovirga pectinis]
MVISKKYISYFLKTLAIFLGGLAIYQFVDKTPWEKVVITHPILLVFAFLLMPVNWLLESYRWKLLISPLVKLNFKQALIGVLSGLGAAFLGGRAIGNSLGRYWVLPQNIERKKSVGALFFSQFTQGIFTYIYGTLSVFLLIGFQWLFPIKWTAVFILFIVIFISIIGLFYSIKSSSKIKELFIYYFDMINEYDKPLILKTLTAAQLRYFIFSFQFILVMLSLDVQLSFQTLCLVVPSIFLIKTLAPSLSGMLDLGARELSTLYIFTLLNADVNIALMSSLIIWGINILLPSLVGLTIRWRL